MRSADEHAARSRRRPAPSTWAWEDEPGAPSGGAESVVTVEFVADGAGTRVVVVHEGLASGRPREMQAHGWGACLANLASGVLGPA
jgi:uncharacterized protein YndB with AHSA1/START domain